MWDLSKKEYRSKNYIKNNYPDLYSFLLNTDGDTFSEKLYRFINGIKNGENITCKTCGALLKYNDYNRGYGKYCSSKCSNSNEDKKSICKQTCLEKYGTENVFQSDIIKDKIKSTCLKKYKVEYAAQSNIVKNNIKLSCLEKYGTENVFQSDIIKDKIKSTCLKKYKVEYASRNKNIMRSQIKTMFLNHTQVKYPEILNMIYNEGYIMYRCKCPHENCNCCNEKEFYIKNDLFHSRKHHGQELCTKLLKYKGKNVNNSIELVVINILRKLKIKFEVNNRKIIKPYELDIFLPEQNIAIECNGLRWHSDKFKEKNYHFNKFKRCKEAGIKLLSFWEDIILLDPEFIENTIVKYAKPELRKNPEISPVILEKEIYNGKEYHINIGEDSICEINIINKLSHHIIFIKDTNKCNIDDIKKSILYRYIYAHKSDKIYIYINNDYQYDIFNILNDCKFDRYYANNVWVNKQKTFDYIRYNNKPTGVKSSNLYNIYTSGYSVYKIF